MRARRRVANPTRARTAGRARRPLPTAAAAGRTVLLAGRRLVVRNPGRAARRAGWLRRRGDRTRLVRSVTGRLHGLRPARRALALGSVLVPVRLRRRGPGLRLPARSRP